MRDIIEGLGILMSALLIALLIIAVIVAMTAGIGAIFERQRCSSLSALESDYEFRYGLWTGCLVKTPNGFWVSVDEAGYLLLEQVPAQN